MRLNNETVYPNCHSVAGKIRSKFPMIIYRKYSKFKVNQSNLIKNLKPNKTLQIGIIENYFYLNFGHIEHLNSFSVLTINHKSIYF